VREVLAVLEVPQARESRWDPVDQSPLWHPGGQAHQWAQLVQPDPVPLSLLVLQSVLLLQSLLVLQLVLSLQLVQLDRYCLEVPLTQSVLGDQRVREPQFCPQALQGQERRRVLVVLEVQEALEVRECLCFRLRFRRWSNQIPQSA